MTPSGDGGSRPGAGGRGQAASLVLYCLAPWPGGDGPARFFLHQKQGFLTFPCTKLRAGEDIRESLRRPLEEDVGLAPGAYFLEAELGMLPRHGEQVRRYPGLEGHWYLYPVEISLEPEADLRGLDHLAGGRWLTLQEVAQRAQEPNVAAMAGRLLEGHPHLSQPPRPAPSMEARASRWAASRDQGVRVLQGEELRSILAAGDRAFNLRVADPYLPYQRQGLGFTWSFFTPADRQDLHVHGMPAVEVYGVMEGRLQLWHKPVNQRGARAWQRQELAAGDWAEVDPLLCHFAAWLTPRGLGTVFKAAGTGELAGVGKIGVAGKTTCRDCHMAGRCEHHPVLDQLVAQYQLPYTERDYQTIAELGRQPA